MLVVGRFGSVLPLWGLYGCQFGLGGVAVVGCWAVWQCFALVGGACGCQFAAGWGGWGGSMSVTAI